MKKIFLFVTVLATSFSVQAQKETGNWTFGYGAGLTWNTTRDLVCAGIGGTPSKTLLGLPTSFTSAIHTDEGCYSISDTEGNLLFYSDGMTVYDKNNAIMTNGTGLGGGSSSTQSGIILPYPGSQNKYINVSIAQAGGGSDAKYSIIDMSSGTGSVVAGQKAIPFSNGQGSIIETVTSTLHSNKLDYWIVAPGRGSTAYLNAWLATSTGVLSTTPTKITTLPFPVVPDPSGVGTYMKFSPDNKHFVWGGGLASNLLIFGDFNDATGEFSNIRKITLPNEFGFSYSYGAYGIEFSRSMKYLYVGGFSGSIYVFDFEAVLAASDPNTVPYLTLPTATNVSSSSRRALQMGPDGRIYASNNSFENLYIVENPEEYTALRVYQTPNGFLGGKISGMGLPSFAASWFKIKPTAKKFACTGYDYKFKTTVDMSGSNAPVKLNINYGDGSTGTVNLVGGQTSYEIMHPYTASGTYTVSITPVKSDNSTLTPTTVSAEVVDCTIRTNRMIRVDLQNLNTATGVQP